MYHALLSSPPLTAIWAPLLQFIQVQHPQFAAVLGSRICALLVSPESFYRDQQAEQDAKPDPSYLSCLARWVNWVVNSFEGSYHDLRRDISIQLLQDLGHAFPLPNQDKSR